MSQDADDIALGRFLSGRTDNADFHHRDHLRVAFALLTAHAFPEAAQLYSRSLRAIAARAGRPGAYHETITLGFLSLLSERMASGHVASFDTFAEANPDLLDKDALARWYSHARLRSDIARRTFVLP